jgi:hypothetical protein
MEQRVNIITLGVADVPRTWEVAYIKGLALHEDGAVALGAAA